MCNRFWKTYRTALAAALLLVAACPALAQATQPADPRLDHVEDELAAKLPGYVRFDKNPPPPPPPGLYADLGGIPAGARPQVACDVSKLTGNVLLTDASGYTATADVTANLYAATPGTVAIVAPGKQIVVRGISAGVVFDGKGKAGLEADDDNEHAMVHFEDGVRLHTVRVTGSQGVGCSIVGQGIKSWNCEFDHNGAHGRGGKSKGDGTEGSGYAEYDARLHDNNPVLRKTNAGNKITRCADWLIVRPHYFNECGPGQWLDNYNQRILFVDPIFEGGTPDKKGNPPVGFRTELGLPGGVTLLRPVFINIAGAALSIDESSNVRVIDPAFVGTCKYAAELRNLLRKDDDTGQWKNGQVVDESKFTCRLFDVSIEGDVKVSPGTGPVVASSAVAKGARPVTLSNNRLSFASPLVVKIPN